MHPTKAQLREERTAWRRIRNAFAAKNLYSCATLDCHSYHGEIDKFGICHAMCSVATDLFLRGRLQRRFSQHQPATYYHGLGYNWSFGPTGRAARVRCCDRILAEIAQELKR